MSLYKIKRELRKHKNKNKALVFKKFFKTKPSEYAYKDVFLGIDVPTIREIANKYKNLKFNFIKKLLTSKIHEERLLAILILLLRFKEVTKLYKEKIYKFYLANTSFINSWDLVDLSAYHIVGEYLEDKDRKPLYDLAKSNLIWDRRIAIVSTFYYIKRLQFKDTLEISKILLNDKEPLIQKAVGWMLREVGKRNTTVLEGFLNKYYKQMPRIMLRYAIEKFPKEKRNIYLNKN